MVALGFEVIPVRAQAWKAAMGLLGTEYSKVLMGFQVQEIVFLVQFCLTLYSSLLKALYVPKDTGESVILMMTG